MSRVQLALNVDDIDAAVAFYAKLFSAEPAKRRPGYANFALDDPALKLVLIENPGQGGSLNHLGVEVASTTDVVDATQRLSEHGFATDVEDATTCCYALQDKVWVTGPGGERWEVYTVLADANQELEGQTATELSQIAGDGACCAPDSANAAAADATAEPVTASACC